MNSNSVQAAKEQTVQGVSRSKIDLLFHWSILTADKYDRIVISPPIQRSKLLHAALKRKGSAVKRMKELKSSNEAALHYLTTPHIKNFDLPQLRGAALCSLKRAWGLEEKDFLTRSSGQSFATCCLVIRDNSVIEVSCSSPNWSLDNFKKGLAYASSTSLRKIFEKEIKNDDAENPRTFRVPGQVAMAILLAFSSFANQMQFGAKFRHFYNNQDSFTFFLGSLPPVSMKLPSGCISPTEDLNTSLGFERSHVNALRQEAEQRAQASKHRRRQLHINQLKVDESEKTLKDCAEKLETCNCKDDLSRYPLVQLKDASDRSICRMKCRKRLDEAYRTLLATLADRQPLEAKIVIPNDLIPYVLGKRHRNIQEIERNAPGTKIRNVTNEICIVSQTEASAKKAIGEICSKASIARHFDRKFKRFNRDRVILIPTPSIRVPSTGFTLVRPSKEKGKFTHRFKCNKHSAEINFDILEEMAKAARECLEKCQNGTLYKFPLEEIHTWFSLGQIKHSVSEKNQSDVITVGPTELGFDHRFIPGLHRKDFDFRRIESFLKERPGCQHLHTYVRHTIIIYTPSFVSRNYIVRIPTVDPDEEEAYIKAAGHPLTSFCKGQRSYSVGPGYLCEKLFNDFDFDVLMPDLQSDCRLQIKAATLDHSEERLREDEILVEKFCKRVHILGTYLYLPTLPRGYIKEYHRKSTSSVFIYKEIYEIMITQEDEVQNGPTIEKEPSKEGKRVVIRVKDRKIHEHLRASNIGNWKIEKILQRMKECVKVVRTLVRMIEEWE